MSELRQDPVSGRWVVIAPGRSQRPKEYPHLSPPSSPKDCPFCEGHESWTPPEIVAERPTGRVANGPGWTVRAIPNKFPTFSVDGSAEAGVEAPPGHVSRPGHGFHEVIIETPDHAARLANLPLDRTRTFLRILRDRARSLAATPGIASLVTFENAGPESGASLFHPHAQIVAVPEIVPVLAEELAGALRYSRGHPAECAFETVLGQERSARRRIVTETGAFTAYCPFASELPYEVRVVPHRHSGSLGDTTDAEIDVLAGLLPELLRRFEAVAPEASYNFVVRSLAEGRPEREAYHWHLDLLPRLIRPDGFEVGGGIHVNPFPPEVAAEELRSVAVRSDGPRDPPAGRAPKG